MLTNMDTFVHECITVWYTILTDWDWKEGGFDISRQILQTSSYKYY